MLSKIERFESNGVSSSALVGRVFLTFWRGAPSPSDIEEIMIPFARFTHVVHGVGMLLWYTGDGALSCEVAQRSIGIAKQFGKGLSALAVVESSGGLWSQMNRIAMGVIAANLAASSGATSRFFVDRRQAIRWLVQTLELSEDELREDALIEATSWMESYATGVAPHEECSI
jgi:hypothetical protein